MIKIMQMLKTGFKACWNIIIDKDVGLKTYIYIFAELPTKIAS